MELPGGGRVVVLKDVRSGFTKAEIYSCQVYFAVIYNHDPVRVAFKREGAIRIRFSALAGGGCCGG